MNDLTKTSSNLPASVLNMQGLANSIQQVGAGGMGGEQYMKMNRFGEFLYGAEDIEVEDDSLWAVNPNQFTHGWICWGTKAHGTDGQMMGEVMVPASGPMPAEADLPVTEGKWTNQVGISLLCMTGEDEGIQALFKTNSLGGKKAYTALVAAVVAEAAAGSEAYCPVIKMENDSYNHKTYGKIFTPVFEIVKWITLDGLEAAAEEEEEDEEEAAPPTRTRKTKAKKAKAPKVSKEELDPEPEPEVEDKPAPRRRRRRSAA